MLRDRTVNSLAARRNIREHDMRHGFRRQHQQASAILSSFDAKVIKIC